MPVPPDDAPLDGLLDELLDSYHAEPRTRHLDRQFMPSRARTIEAIELLRRLIFPGFFEETRLTSDTIRPHTARLLRELHALLGDQVEQALRHTPGRRDGEPEDATPSNGDAHPCTVKAAALTAEFLRQLPELRRLLALDVQATFDGDPAARSTEELIFCYPGIDAIFIHRVAHALHKLNVPLLPRIMSEYAHNETGVDIHPGATIGESFCLDHGTGVVMGETTILGNHVKMYQGVTLGALSTKGRAAVAGHQTPPHHRGRRHHLRRGPSSSAAKPSSARGPSSAGPSSSPSPSPPTTPSPWTATNSGSNREKPVSRDRARSRLNAVPRTRFELVSPP